MASGPLQKTMKTNYKDQLTSTIISKYRIICCIKRAFQIVYSNFLLSVLWFLFRWLVWICNTLLMYENPVSTVINKVYSQISAGLRTCGCNRWCLLISAGAPLRHLGPSEDWRAHETAGRAAWPGQVDNTDVRTKLEGAHSYNWNGEQKQAEGVTGKLWLSAEDKYHPPTVANKFSYSYHHRYNFCI